MHVLVNIRKRFEGSGEGAPGSYYTRSVAVSESDHIVCIQQSLKIRPDANVHSEITSSYNSTVQLYSHKKGFK